MKTFPFLLLLILLFGCKNPESVEVYSYGNELELKLGEKAVIKSDNITVEFVEVLEDSRCPANVTCVWAGNGKVQIRFEHTEIQLNTYLEPLEATLEDVNIQLLSLDPYPEYPGQFEEDDYKVRLLITKK